LPFWLILAPGNVWLLLQFGFIFFALFIKACAID